MINFSELENRINANKFENCYMFCGFNENIIKKNIKEIIKKNVNDSFIDLNYFQYDGNNVEYDQIFNACETLPFMSEKKVVVIYRADFLSDKTKNTNKNGNEIIKELQDYAAHVPAHCILIMYYVYANDREKLSSKVKKFDKKVCVVEFTKLKGAMLQKKVKEMFAQRGKDIDKSQLGFFCSEVENNMDIIKNEIDKLCDFTEDKPIEKQDILDLSIAKSDKDIFNLVDFLSQRKPEIAINILDDLMFRGEKATSILSMIERQYNIMLNLKIGMEKGKGKEELAREFRLHPYVCEKMMIQCKGYTIKQIIRAEEICIETEKQLKSQGSDDKIKMELLLIKSAII